MKTRSTRRDFLASTAAAGAGAMLVPRHVLGGPGQTPPSEKMNIAGIGVGGMGGANLKACQGESIVALCEVDSAYAAETIALFPKATSTKTTA